MFEKDGVSSTSYWIYLWKSPDDITEPPVVLFSGEKCDVYRYLSSCNFFSALIVAVVWYYIDLYFTLSMNQKRLYFQNIQCPWKSDVQLAIYTLNNKTHFESKWFLVITVEDPFIAPPKGVVTANCKFSLTHGNKEMQTCQNCRGSEKRSTNQVLLKRSQQKVVKTLSPCPKD